MLDIDRRSFVAGVGIGALPISGCQPAVAQISVTDIGLMLGSGLNISEATGAAMAGRARRFVGRSGAILSGSPDGQSVQVVHAPSKHGSWLLRGVPGSETILACATAFLCERATDRLAEIGASFRWYSGCSFGGATAHLFRGSKSAVFLVTRAVPEHIVPKRLDIVIA